MTSADSTDAELFQSKLIQNQTRLTMPAFDLMKTRTNSRRAKRSPARTKSQTSIMPSVGPSAQTERPSWDQFYNAQPISEGFYDQIQDDDEDLTHQHRHKVCRFGSILRHPLREWKLIKNERLAVRRRAEVEKEADYGIPASRLRTRRSSMQDLNLARRLQAQEDSNQINQASQSRLCKTEMQMIARQTDSAACGAFHAPWSNPLIGRRNSVSGHIRHRRQHPAKDDTLPLIEQRFNGLGRPELISMSTSSSDFTHSYKETCTAPTSCRNSIQELSPLDFLQIPTADPSRTSSSNNLSRFSRGPQVPHHKSFDSLNSVNEQLPSSTCGQSVTSLARARYNNIMAADLEYSRQEVSDQNLQQLQQHQSQRPHSSDDASDDSDNLFRSPATSRARQQAARERQQERDRRAALLDRAEVLQVGRFLRREPSDAELEERHRLAQIDRKMQEHISTMRRERKRQARGETEVARSESQESRERGRPGQSEEARTFRRDLDSGEMVEDFIDYGSLFLCPPHLG